MKTDVREISDPDLASAFGTDQVGQLEIYSALMDGFDQQEQHHIEDLMSANIRRLIDEGDSYST